MEKTKRTGYKHIDWYSIYLAYRKSGFTLRDFHSNRLPQLISSLDPDLPSTPSLSSFIRHMQQIRDKGSSRAADSRSIACRVNCKEIYRRWVESGERKVDFIQDFIRRHGKVLSYTSLYKILKNEENAVADLKKEKPADNTVTVVNLELPQKEHTPSVLNERNSRNTINISFPSGVQLQFYTVDPELSTALIIRHLSGMNARG